MPVVRRYNGFGGRRQDTTDRKVMGRSSAGSRHSAPRCLIHSSVRSYLTAGGAIAGAGVQKLGGAMVEGQTIATDSLITAGLTFLVALGAIAFLMKMVRHYSLLPFVIYRLLLGVVLLALIYSGVPLGAAG